MAGMSLHICGLIMQQITRNKFVSPTTAGTMDWARLGVLISLLVFASASPLLKMSIAFIFSLAGNLLFMRILDRIKFNDTIYIPLVGLMLGSIVSSLATFIAYKYDLIQNLSSWLQGDFSLVVKGRYELLYLSIPLVIIAYLYADKFTGCWYGRKLFNQFRHEIQTNRKHWISHCFAYYVDYDFDRWHAAFFRINHSKYRIDLPWRSFAKKPALYSAAWSCVRTCVRYFRQSHYFSLMKSLLG